MKINLGLVLILLVSFLSINKILPQTKEDSSKVKLKIDAFSNMLRNYDVTFNEKLNNIDTLKKMARIMYETNESDAIETENIRNRMIGLNKAKDSGEPDSIPPAIIIGTILDKIEENISTSVCALTKTAFFLKAQVIKSELVKHEIKHKMKGKDEISYTGRIDVTVKIEETIKGENRFKVGEEIKFIYFPFWRENAASTFIVGGSYFLPLDILTNVEGSKMVVLRTLDTKEKIKGKKPSLGCFPIEQSNLIDVNNYFGFGENILWPEFRDKMISLINLIKSW
jgi:hypothetical protein